MPRACRVCQGKIFVLSIWKIFSKGLPSFDQFDLKVPQLNILISRSEMGVYDKQTTPCNNHCDPNLPQ